MGSGQEHRAGTGNQRRVLAFQPLSPMTLGETFHPTGVLVFSSVLENISVQLTSQNSWASERRSWM